MSGAGGGSIQNMINSYRDNMKMLRKTRLFRSGKTIFERKGIAGEKSGELIYKKADKAWLEDFEKKLRKEKRVNNIRLGITWFIIIAFAGVLVYAVTRLVSVQARYDLKGETGEQYIKDRKLNERYNYFVNQGDRQVALKQWESAIDGYREAIKINPDLPGAREKLARVYTLLCSTKDEYCNEAYMMLNYLARTYPDNIEIYKLMVIYYTAKGDNEKLAKLYKKIDKLEADQ